MTRKNQTVADLLASLFLTASACYLLANLDRFISQGLPSPIDPGFFPRFILCVVLVFSLALVAGGCRDMYRMHRHRRNPNDVLTAYTDADAHEPEERTAGLYCYLAILLTYFLCFDTLGFLLATPPVMFAIARLLGNTNLTWPFVGFIIFSAIMDQVFLRAMKLPLPSGILPF